MSSCQGRRQYGVAPASPSSALDVQRSKCSLETIVQRHKFVSLSPARSPNFVGGEGVQIEVPVRISMISTNHVRCSMFVNGSIPGMEVFLGLRIGKSKARNWLIDEG
jgi:hypothetical protein